MKHFARALVVVLIYTFLQGGGAVRADGGTTIQGGHSGNWYNFGQSGHGVFAEVLDDPASPTGKKMVVAWYAFFDHQQVWILAVGDVIQDGEGQAAVMTAWIYEGNGFPPHYSPGAWEEIPWGEIRIWFIGCDDAVLEWASQIQGFGSGMLIYLVTVDLLPESYREAGAKSIALVALLAMGMVAVLREIVG